MGHTSNLLSIQLLFLWNTINTKVVIYTHFGINKNNKKKGQSRVFFFFKKTETLYLVFIAFLEAAPAAVETRPVWWSQQGSYCTVKCCSTAYYCDNKHLYTRR